MCHLLLHLVTLWEYTVINICYVIIKTNQLIIYHEMLHIYSKLLGQDYSETYPNIKCNNMSVYIHCIDVYLCVVNINLGRQLVVLSPQYAILWILHTTLKQDRMYKIHICCCSHQYWKLLSFSSDLIHYQITYNSIESNTILCSFKGS